MRAWIVDGANFLKTGEKGIKKGDLTTTNKIDTFLKEDNINFIVAPKGYGKTILLIYKRLSYEYFNKKPGFKYIPSGSSLIDIPKGGAANLNWGELMIKFYKDQKNWEGIWRVCISLSMVQIIKKCSLDTHYSIKESNDWLEEIRKDKDGVRYPLLRKLIYEHVFGTPLSYLNHILTNFNQSTIRNLLKEQQFMDELVADIEIPIAIFIDNVDEYFSEHFEKEGEEHSPSVRGIFDIDLWYVSQQGLMFAIKSMCRSNRHLDIFASVRKEAYINLKGSTVENIRGACIDIHYSHSKLKNIFKNNILWMDKKHLIKPDEIHSNPIFSFLGICKIEHESTGENEDIFDYVYRHTLQRPRDIVSIGGSLAEIDNEDRNTEAIRIEINKVATQIANDYMDIFLPHTCFDGEAELKDVFNRIPHNILRLENLKHICCSFNNNHNKNNKNCKTCNKKHIFCDLYKLGLLGIVMFDTNENRYKQKFLSLGEKTFESHVLPINHDPEDNYYLIHPILNDIIGGNPKTRVNKEITVGYNKDWTKPKLPDFLTKKYKIFLSHSSYDKAFVDKLATSLHSENIRLWYDKWNIEVGDSIVDEIDKGIKESDFLGIVISRNSLNSNWVKEELNSGIVRQLKEKKTFILPILIDNVWNDVPSFLSEKKYADFRTNHKSGTQELINKLIGL